MHLLEELFMYSLILHKIMFEDLTVLIDILERGFGLTYRVCSEYLFKLC